MTLERSREARGGRGDEEWAPGALESRADVRFAVCVRAQAPRRMSVARAGAAYADPSVSSSA